jgi:hypothetical protein
MRIQFLNYPAKIGGPGTFQIGLCECLVAKGHIVDVYPSKHIPDAIFVISGSRRIFWLIKNKILGVKIIQRLDGYNWRSRDESVNLKTYLKAKIQNLIIFFIRKYLANLVIYQSSYVKSLWEEGFGSSKTNSIIIHNSASNIFFNNQNKQNGNYKIVCVEGAIQLDPLTRKMLNALDRLVLTDMNIDSVDIYGRLECDIANEYPNISFKGEVDRSDIPLIYSKNKVIFLLLERYPPCPNSLIESICSGVPSIGLNEGAYIELSEYSGYAINPVFLEDSKQDKVNRKIEEGIRYIIQNYKDMSEKSIIRSKLFKRKVMCHKYIENIDLIVNHNKNKWL